MLGFSQYLTEVLDQKSAIRKLDQIVKDNYSVWSERGTTDCENIFRLEPEEPPYRTWTATLTYRQKVGGIKFQNVPVNKLIPTQHGLNIEDIKRFIKQNPNRWNDDEKEVVLVVQKDNKFYVMDGHHRCAAAILMGYRTVPCELQPSS